WRHHCAGGDASRPGRPWPGPRSRRARDTPRGLTGATAPVNVDAERMSTIHLHEHMTVTPEKFIAGLTDFGPGREKLFGNSADGELKVHDQGPTSADVTEGSGGVWERLQYEWSDPDRVGMRNIDSRT